MNLVPGPLPWLGGAAPASVKVLGTRLPSNASYASVKAGSEISENGLLSGSERRKRSVAALRWISLMTFL